MSRLAWPGSCLFLVLVLVLAGQAMALGRPTWLAQTSSGCLWFGPAAPGYPWALLDLASLTLPWLGPDSCQAWQLLTKLWP